MSTSVTGCEHILLPQWWGDPGHHLEQHPPRMTLSLQISIVLAETAAWQRDEFLRESLVSLQAASQSGTLGLQLAPEEAVLPSVDSPLECIWQRQFRPLSSAQHWALLRSSSPPIQLGFVDFLENIEQHLAQVPCCFGVQGASCIQSSVTTELLWL